MVWDILMTRGPLFSSDLDEVTGLPARTVRFAVAVLRERGLVVERRCLGDARRRVVSPTE